MPSFFCFKNAYITSLSFHLLANNWLPVDIFPLLLICEKCRLVVLTGTERRVGGGDVLALANALLAAPGCFKKRPRC